MEDALSRCDDTKSVDEPRNLTIASHGVIRVGREERMLPEPYAGTI